MDRKLDTKRHGIPGQTADRIQANLAEAHLTLQDQGLDKAADPSCVRYRGFDKANCTARW